MWSLVTKSDVDVFSVKMFYEGPISNGLVLQWQLLIEVHLLAFFFSNTELLDIFEKLDKAVSYVWIKI